MNLGGGVTGGQQPCDGALNQHVRRQYGMVESNKLMHQMMSGVSLPTTTEADVLAILHTIWNTDEQLHMQAAKGFKEAGLSVDLDGSEDYEIAKEAADMWWAPVPAMLGDYANMRDKLNDELEDIEEQWKK